jgi:hypothetical protein
MFHALAAGKWTAMPAAPSGKKTVLGQHVLETIARLGFQHVRHSALDESVD